MMSYNGLLVTQLLITSDDKFWLPLTKRQMVKIFQIKQRSSQSLSDKPDINYTIAIVMVGVHWRWLDWSDDNLLNRVFMFTAWTAFRKWTLIKLVNQLMILTTYWYINQLYLWMLHCEQGPNCVITSSHNAQFELFQLQSATEQLS